MLALPGSSDFFPLPLSARKPALFSLSAPSLEHCLFLSFFCLCLLSPGPPLSHHTVLPSYLAFLTWSSSLACLHFLISYRHPLFLSDFFFKVISCSFSNFFSLWLLKMSSNNYSKLVRFLCYLACFLPFFCFAYWLAGTILKNLQTIPFVVLYTSTIWISTATEEGWGSMLLCLCDLRVNINYLLAIRMQFLGLLIWFSVCLLHCLCCQCGALSFPWHSFSNLHLLTFSFLGPSFPGDFPHVTQSSVN